MNNKKGMSLFGLLITVLLIAILIKLMVPLYQKVTVKPHYEKRQTLPHVRATIEQAEKSAAQRANPDLNF